MSGPAYDCNGIAIQPGDLIRTFHFTGARRRRHWLYHTAVNRHGELWMVPTSELEPTLVGDGGVCRIWAEHSEHREIIAGAGPSPGTLFYHRPKACRAALQTERGDGGVSKRHEHDIKAPDGYLLGGLRRVRANGTILFQRDYWQAPKEWAGQDVWVHQDERSDHTVIEAAPPGVHIYTARSASAQVICEPIDRPSAKPGYRTAVNRAWWVARNKMAAAP